MELHFLRALQTTPTYTHWLLDTQREQKSLVVYEGFKAWMSWRCISCQCYYLKDVSQLVKKKKNRVIRGHWLDVPKASGYIKWAKLIWCQRGWFPPWCCFLCAATASVSQRAQTPHSRPCLGSSWECRMFTFPEAHRTPRLSWNGLAWRGIVHKLERPTDSTAPPPSSYDVKTLCSGMTF